MATAFCLPGAPLPHSGLVPPPPAPAGGAAASRRRHPPAAPTTAPCRRCRHAPRMAADGAPGRRRHTRFRPCIDLHGGLVKQIVGGTLSDAPAAPTTATAAAAAAALETNFSTTTPAAAFAARYAADDLPGGHVIMLGPGNEEAARSALAAYPGGLHVGGGIGPTNARGWLDAGASHVIVTSYVFRGGAVDWDRVAEMRDCVGKARLVLDVSCRKRAVAAGAAGHGAAAAADGGGGGGGDGNGNGDGNGDGAVEYVVCTDRWTRTSDFVLGAAAVRRLAANCDELLVHAVDEEGRRGGIDGRLVTRLAAWASGAAAGGGDLPVVYAGGARALGDLATVDRLSGGGST
ncbi:hypothetical protein BU14_0413s0011 [Porphyra umbilicalis]|uniref:Uncharacterized protein n=1 Tax=Porphyra umbilicalis TaxID=2786 RepID=A0A1X6NWF0_PORUM|nr:hypothetical protein BU14_0413s0011 [Porphyra umbilicalis]|eukprot:OSX72703.1 hypothetical protein BU14_0413s0011 [Porphyra umbilicalis]